MRVGEGLSTGRRGNIRHKVADTIVRAGLNYQFH
jgi:hypothetical protein